MKEYQKPDLELIEFTSVEEIANSGAVGSMGTTTEDPFAPIG